MSFILKKLILSLLILFCGIKLFALSTPQISANALFLYQNSNLHSANVDPSNPDSTPNGVNLKEAEIQFFSDVDPYTRLNLVLALSPEISSDGVEVSESWIFEPEEAYAESSFFPQMTLKLGKFKAAMGKHNTLHTHAFPLIEKPYINSQLLGNEGLNDSGLSSAILLPASWYSELTFQYLRGKGENNEFNSPSPGKGVGLIHFKNLFDLSSDLTFELGLSSALGENSFSGTTSLNGVNFQFKWRPSEGGRYQSFQWATEYLSRNRGSSLDVPIEKGSGISSWIQYQFLERWSALYRYDNLTLENSLEPSLIPNDRWNRNSVALVFKPTEFANYKLEYEQGSGPLGKNPNDRTEKSLLLLANFTIGAHPAHGY